MEGDSKKEGPKPNKIVSFFRTIRNNWKKSTFGVILLGFGYNYALDKYRTQQFMRAYCKEAKKYGEQPLPISVKPRHVTVILNPASKNGKGKKLYEKYSSPLLHLAGVKVSVIQTEAEGQARTITEIMNNTDAILVAGGDGTLHEVVTGLLRREDEATASKQFPVGIAPIGKQNLFAKKMFSTPGMTEERLLAESTMAVVREMQEPVDVIQVQGPTGKPVYALKSFECGAFRDTDSTIEKYWYYGGLKAKVAYIMSAFRGPSDDLSLSVSYILPCSGCSSCYTPDPKVAQKQEGSRWWHAFIPKAPNTATTTPSGPDYSKIINEDCGVAHEKNLSCSNLLLTLHVDDSIKAIKADVQDPLNGRFNFLKDGLDRHSASPTPSPLSLQFKEAELAFESNKNEEERWFSIDNEKYEKQNIKVSLLTSKVQMYVGKTIKK